MEVIVLVLVIVFVSPFLLISAHKLSIYSIIVNKGLICFAPKCGWDKDIVKVSCCLMVIGLRGNR
jgi:hypothetical protein